MKTIVFDFDGMIVDTLDSAVRVYNEVSPKLWCRPIDLSDLESLRGEDTREMFAQYGVTSWKLPIIAFLTKRRMGREITDMKIFDGMVELLKELKSDGCGVGLLTSNSKPNINKFLSHNELRSCLISSTLVAVCSVSIRL